MKNLFKSMMLVAVAAMGFTACSKEAVEEVNPAIEKGFSLTISAEKPALESDTRTEFADGSVIWSANDQIRACYYHSAGTGTWSKYYASTLSTVAADGSTATFTKFNPTGNPQGFPLIAGEGTYTFYAGYPSKSNTIGSGTNAPSNGVLSVKVATEQTMSEAGTFDDAADIMVGKATETISGIEDGVNLDLSFNYTRLVAHGCVTLKNFVAEEGEKVLNVTFTAPADVMLTGSGSVNFVEQTMTALDNNTVTVTLPENTAATENVVVWFCSAPATIASGANLTVTVETTRGTYTRTITANANGIKFLQNRYNTLGINMASAEFVAKEVDANDYSGDYYILAKRTTGNFWAATSDLGSASTKRYQAVNTGNTDIDSVNLDEATVWTIEAAGEGTYYLKAGDLYAYWTSGNSSNFTEEVNNAIKFTVNANDDGTYNIHWTASGDERYFALNTNAGSDYFAFYKDTQIINLYLVPAAEDTTPRITAETEVSLTAEECEGTITITTKNVTGKVTATLGEDYDWFAAEINEDGNLYYIASANSDAERTATVTLSAEGAADVVITFTQKAAAVELPGTGEGTEASPYDVTRAIAAIDANETIDNAYVKGIVTESEMKFLSNYSSLSYYISEDGTATNELMVYSGKNLNNADFTLDYANELHAGDEVVVCGQLKLYNGVYEFNYNNYIVSLTCNNGEGGGEEPTPEPGTGDEPGTGEDIAITLDFSTNIFDLNTSGNDASSEITKTYNGYSYLLKATNSCYWFNSKALFLGKANSYVTFPAIEGYKLASVKATSNTGASAKTTFIICNTANTTAITGGTSSTITAGSSKTWTLTDTGANTSYRLYITNGYNAQFTKIELTYVAN